ncbi:MAG TPA: metallophosphoesterase family protein [Sphingomonas sp.]|uniref:metallophosphoesterase family protein n=1 Tax=Sphingomonas sp. TaxID=28214 RepID=UPI002EDB00D1
MLAKLLRSRVRADAQRDALPDGTRVYAVGDIHGRLDLLDELLARIDADDGRRDPAETTIVFLGDLVDRGPDSAGVVDRLRHLAGSGRRVRFLAGNHEEVFVEALAGDLQALKLFCRIGGRETVLSYGVGETDYERLGYDELAEVLARLVPDSHRRFLESFEDMISLGDYLFVHAGVRPDRSLDDQRVGDLRWIRDPFLGHRGRLGKRVVHGHTITPEVEFRPHRIGIDTGAYATGRLTALGLQGTDQWLLQTG